MFVYISLSKLSIIHCQLLSDQFIELGVKRLELFTLIFGIVHLLEYVDHLLEVFHYIEEGAELELGMANLHNLVQHELLTCERGYRIDRIERILLQDHEVDQFRFPEDHVIFHRYTIVTKDVIPEIRDIQGI